MVSHPSWVSVAPWPGEEFSVISHRPPQSLGAGGGGRGCQDRRSLTLLQPEKLDFYLFHRLTFLKGVYLEKVFFK